MPDAPGLVTKIPRDTQVTFTWSAPAFTGGSAVLDYKVKWDQGKNTFADLKTGITETNFTKTGLKAGTTYVFRVLARNEVGYSADSADIFVTTTNNDFL